MKLHRDIESWRSERRRSRARTLGFVPTMGALHAGHAALLERARQENDDVLLSIFVNPTQFNSPDDLAKYPQTLEQDLEVARRCGVDHVFLPTREMMYPDGYRYKVSESDWSTQLCGAHRPGHFDGVLSVVLKLFHIARCDRAYFGEKDFQQLELVRGMASAFFLDLEIVPCPIVREADGLAMSSRNTRLTPAERQRAPLFYKILSQAESTQEATRQLGAAGFTVDYVEDRTVGAVPHRRRFGAINLGAVRLIDNVVLPEAEETA